MCEACGKSFASKEYLRHHSNIHTGTKPYKCELCGRGFAQRNSLHQHLKTHTGNRRHGWRIAPPPFGVTVYFSGRGAGFPWRFPPPPDPLLILLLPPSADRQASVPTAVRTATSSSRSSTPSRGTSASTRERSRTCAAFVGAPSPTSPPFAGTPW